MKRRINPALVAVVMLALVVGVLIGNTTGSTLGSGLRLAGDVVRAVVEFEDGSTVVLVPETTPDPTAMHTATPQPTASVTLTASPAATSTPDHVPTQERETGTPEPVECWIEATTYNINVREVPGGDLVSHMAAEYLFPIGARTRALARTSYNGLSYYKIWWPPTAQQAWIADFVEEQGDCDVLPIEDPFAQAATAWGVWAGPGASTYDVLVMIAQLQAAGVQPAVTVYGANSLGHTAHDAGAFVLARPWLGDHPPYTLPAVDSARAWVDKAVFNLGSGWYDCLVLTNEPIYPNWIYGRDWIDAAIDRAAERGVDCLVPVVFAPGHPPLAAVEILRSAYEDASIEVYWGLNLYPADPDVMLSARTDWTQWTTFRFELYEPPAPIAVTEFARGDGSQPADFADIGQFVGTVDGVIAFGTAWYTAQEAGLGHWMAAVIRRLDTLADAIVRGLL